MSGCVIFSSIYSMREVEMAVLLGICLSAQKPALRAGRSRFREVGIHSGSSARHIPSTHATMHVQYDDSRGSSPRRSWQTASGPPERIQQTTEPCADDRHDYDPGR